jgi:Zn-dependent protease with chaperone function
VRVIDEDPGVPLDLNAEPRLRAVLAEVAEKIATPPVDAVYLTPGVEVAVLERGGLRARFGRRTRRCLVLGVGVLDGMPLRAFKAILGHEYGHLRNEDTAGGAFAAAVERSLITMLMRIARSGAGTWYNPAWWFLRGYLRVFSRLTRGACRLQEILADRWATTAYGAAAFERGLRHVVARSVAFDAQAQTVLKQVIGEKLPLANLYSWNVPSDGSLDAKIEQALEREPSAHDSHPPPTQRIAWVRALGASGTPASPDDDDPAWTLLSDREALERKMTDEIRQNVEERHQVRIAAA